MVAVILAIAAFAIFGYWALSLADSAEQIAVVAAASDLKAPRILVTKDLVQLRVRRDSLPATAVAKMEDAIGLTLLHSISAKQILTINELSKGVDPTLAGFQIPQGLQGMVLSTAWLAGPMPKVKHKDTVTLLVSGAGKSGTQSTGIIAQGVPVLTAEAGTDGVVQRILIAIDMKVAATLLQARANNLLIEVIVDGVGPADALAR